MNMRLEATEMGPTEGCRENDSVNNKKDLKKIGWKMTLIIKIRKGDEISEPYNEDRGFRIYNTNKAHSQ